MIHGMDMEKGSSSTIRASSCSLMEFDSATRKKTTTSRELMLLHCLA